MVNILAVRAKGSPSQQLHSAVAINRWAWLCSNKMLFIKTGGGQIWPVSFSLLSGSRGWAG